MDPHDHIRFKSNDIMLERAKHLDQTNNTTRKYRFGHHSECVDILKQNSFITYKFAQIVRFPKIYYTPAVSAKSFTALVRNRSRLPKIIKCSLTHPVTIGKRLSD